MTPEEKAQAEILRGLALGFDKIFNPKTRDQYNAGARIADDCFCSSCGARGVVGLCVACSR